ncbi:MAG: hypothetical protein DRI61_08575 [Chloroflexi bacterium]|nr:MAG: hypothetical protein DRI61_08575 [Chloroflexota bacterium]HDN80203.1 DUF177 domain-containing protein [Chloroflexota bacterium]
MLAFNVAQLLKEPTGASREYEIEENIEGLDEEIHPAGPLKGKVTFLHAGRYNILVTGTLEVPLHLNCSRCLEAVVKTIRVKLEEEFKATIDVETGASLHWGETVERCNLINSSHILDLTEVIRQNIIVNIPMRVLCKPDCAGLCPYCGHNLNLGPCECKREEIDPRWMPLKKLLEAQI